MKKVGPRGAGEAPCPLGEHLENHDFDLMVKLLRKFGELGLLMMDAPEEYGGLDLPKTTSMLAAEKASLYGGFSVAYTAHSGIGTLPRSSPMPTGFISPRSWSSAPSKG